MTNYHVGECMLCGKSSDIDLTDDQLNRVMIWQHRKNLPNGPFIQTILPELTAGQREQIMSGSHERCFDGFFPEDPDVPPHLWDGAQWTCTECGHQSPDPCDCDCHEEGEPSVDATEATGAESYGSKRG